MADLLIEPRQLASTVGYQASAAPIKTRSAFAGIGDTITIERVLYDSGFPIASEDNLWVPAREDPIASSSFRSKIFISSLEEKSCRCHGNQFLVDRMVETPYGSLSSWTRRRDDPI
jgi:hypothetical protein